MRTRKAVSIRKTIVLLTDELLQDMRNAGWIQSSTIKSEDPEDRNVMRDVTEMNNLEAATRNLDYAVGEVVTALYPYSCGWTRRDASLLSDAYREKDSYTIALLLDRDMPEEVFMHLRTLCHELVVAIAMYRYMLLAYPDGALVWQSNIEMLRKQLDDAKRLGQKPLLRKLYPFY